MGKKFSPVVSHGGKVALHANTPSFNSIMTSPTAMKAYKGMANIGIGILDLLPEGRMATKAIIGAADAGSHGGATGFLGEQNSTLNMIPGMSLVQGVLTTADPSAEARLTSNPLLDPKKMVKSGAITVAHTAVTSHGNPHSTLSTARSVAHTDIKTAKQPISFLSNQPAVNNTISTVQKQSEKPSLFKPPAPTPVHNTPIQHTIVAPPLADTGGVADVKPALVTPQSAEALAPPPPSAPVTTTLNSNSIASAVAPAVDSATSSSSSSMMLPIIGVAVLAFFMMRK